MNKAALGLSVLALIVAGLGWLGGSQSASPVGGGTRFPNGLSVDSTSPSSGQIRGTTFTATGSLNLGSGTSITEINAGTCRPVRGHKTIAATTTKLLSCAASGVQANDVVFAQFATSSNNHANGAFRIVEASASTTAAFIEINVENGTGAARAPYAAGINATTTVMYWAIDL